MSARLLVLAKGFAFRCAQFLYGKTGKDARAMYISGNMLSRFADILLQQRHVAILNEAGP